ncbi:hypothetical protein CNR22_23745 [Sphingobacteriaceae bacterium]|nr:hypothetical protein CNR22_23745 [Sphingobacteriaceae bacterium]
MRIKIMAIGLLLLIGITSFSQERIVPGSKKGIEIIKESTLQVVVGEIGEDYDEAIKTALEKYWKICPVEYVDAKEVDKSKPFLATNVYQGKGWAGKYQFLKLVFTGPKYISCECHFDNLTTEKTGCIGIDIDKAEWQLRGTIAVMNLCAQLRQYEEVIITKEYGDFLKFEGYTQKIKTTTILIPTEYLQNGITKNAFKKLPKHEFLSLAEIAKRIADGKTKGYAIFTGYVAIPGRFLNIIDLDTGDYLFYKELGGGYVAGGTSMPDKLTDKDIIKALEKI